MLPLWQNQHILIKKILCWELLQAGPFWMTLITLVNWFNSSQFSMAASCLWCRFCSCRERSLFLPSEPHQELSLNTFTRGRIYCSVIPSNYINTIAVVILTHQQEYIYSLSMPDWRYIIKLYEGPWSDVCILIQRTRKIHGRLNPSL